MPFVRDGRVLLRHAFEGGYTLPAFNVCSAEMVRACLEAAEALDAPLILQTYPSDLQQIAPRQMVALIESYAADSRVPVMLHLDHGPDLDTALACLRAGYSSVMYDGAGQPFEAVLATTRHLSEAAHAQGAAVEVGAESFDGSARALTDPEEAARLHHHGGADMVAVSVGSEHGRSGALDLPLLGRIAEAVAGPLVLHGGSGISAADYRAARGCGVVKANIGSALYRALRAVWQGSADADSHRQVYARAREALRRVAHEKLEIMHTAGQASAFAYP